MLNKWELVQAPEEHIRAFSIRILGIADLCNMFIDCPKEDCDTRVSYRDKVVQQVLLKGMSNLEIRSRVLSRTKNGKLTKLSDIVDYIATEESSLSASTQLVHENSVQIAANRRSTYKKEQRASLQSTNKCRFSCTHG